MEKRDGLFKSVLLAVKTLGKDYSAEERDIEKQVKEIQKVEEEIKREQEQFGASLRVKKIKTSSSSTKAKRKEKTTKTIEDREEEK